MHRFVMLALAGAVVAAMPIQAAPRDSASSEAAAGSPDKIVCKSFLRTGTLADRYRTCKTKREWERERENVRQDAASRVATCRMNDERAVPCK